ncbi:MAG: DUF1614 domain-containing protein, partial [Methanobacteriota archaeon]
VAIVVHATSRFDPEQGVLLPFWLPAILAASLSLGLTSERWRHVGIRSFSAGAIGTVIGADIVRIPQFAALDPPQTRLASIGGGGTLDAIYVVSVAAVLLSMVGLVVTRGRR